MPINKRLLVDGSETTIKIAAHRKYNYRVLRFGVTVTYLFSKSAHQPRTTLKLSNFVSKAYQLHASCQPSTVLCILYHHSMCKHLLLLFSPIEIFLNKHHRLSICKSLNHVFTLRKSHLRIPNHLLAQAYLCHASNL